MAYCAMHKRTFSDVGRCPYCSPISYWHCPNDETHELKFTGGLDSKTVRCKVCDILAVWALPIKTPSGLSDADFKKIWQSRIVPPAPDKAHSLAEKFMCEHLNFDGGHRIVKEDISYLAAKIDEFTQAALNSSDPYEETLRFRCQERHAEVGQCERPHGHEGKHLAGYLMWEVGPSLQVNQIGAQPQTPRDCPQPSPVGEPQGVPDTVYGIQSLAGKFLVWTGSDKEFAECMADGNRPVIEYHRAASPPPASERARELAKKLWYIDSRVGETWVPEVTALIESAFAAKNARIGELEKALRSARVIVRGRHSTLSYGPQSVLDEIDAALAKQQTEIPSVNPPKGEVKPWLYAIAEPGGAWHDGEQCVFGDKQSCMDEVELLNDDLNQDEPQYSVVPLFRLDERTRELS